MRHFLLFLIPAAMAVAQSPVAGIKNVYLTPMPGGLEQYIALHLTQEGVMQVVTDPAKAEAVFTDQIGEDLKRTLSELGAKPAATAGKAGETTFVRPNMRPLARAKGTVFLVSRETGDVLWSTLEQPKSSALNDLNAAAKKIVDRLEKARGKN